MPERRRSRRPRLDIEIVEESGDWSSFEDIEALVQAASAEVATEPQLNMKPAAAVVVLSSDADVAALNGRYRGKPHPTNVLSFPPGPVAEAGFLGDIVLALETIGREAEEQDVSAEHHLQHLVVHGLLHLLGFDHENDGDADIMEALEIKILARLGIANPYTAPLDRAKG